MELKDFIKTTLVEIAEGIEAAQNHASLGGQIAPSKIGGHKFSDDSGIASNSRITSTVVQFDVAIMTTSSISGQAESKGKIFVAEVGGKVEGARSSNQSSRIQFSVPFVFQENKNTWHE